MAAKLFQMAPDQKLDPAQYLGAQFANRILVKCSVTAPGGAHGLATTASATSDRRSAPPILLWLPASRPCAGAGHPFGVGAPKAPPPAAPSSGIVGWIMVKQAEFYKGLSGAIRAAKTDGTALWVLFGLSFAYGVFHAAGPGHGKAVISSYVVANRETWWRGVVLSFASAMVQAVVAVAMVGIAAVLLNATAATMKTTVYWIEIVSYLLIIAIGVRLVWVKGRAAIAACRDLRKPKTVGAAATPAHRTTTTIMRITATRTMTMHTVMHHEHDHAITHASRPRHAHHDHAHHDHGHAHDHHDHAHCDITITRRPGAMRTRRSRRSWPGPAAGSAA